MTKSTEKKKKATISVRKPSKTAQNQTKAAEYVSCLLELHKLQGALLTHLKKEVLGAA